MWVLLLTYSLYWLTLCSWVNLLLSSTSCFPLMSYCLYSPAKKLRRWSMKAGFFGISVQESYRHFTGAQWRKCSYAAGGITRGHVNRYASCHAVYCAVPDMPQCPLTVGEINTKKQSSDAPFSWGRGKNYCYSSSNSQSNRRWQLGLAGKGSMFSDQLVPIAHRQWGFGENPLFWAWH